MGGARRAIRADGMILHPSGLWGGGGYLSTSRASKNGASQPGAPRFVLRGAVLLLSNRFSFISHTGATQAPMPTGPRTILTEAQQQPHNADGKRRQARGAVHTKARVPQQHTKASSLTGSRQVSDRFQTDFRSQSGLAPPAGGPGMARARISEEGRHGVLNTSARA